MKRLALVLTAFLLISGFAHAQQFAKTGLVNLTRIYSQFYKDSKGVRDFEALKASIQSDINSFKDEIRQLNDKKNDALGKGDSEQAQALDDEIQRKQDALQEFARVKQLELKQKSDEVKKDDSFQKIVSSEIEQEAISKGFSMILNIENDSSIVWYSPDADITDGVISRLQVDLAPTSTSGANPQAPQPTPSAKP